MTFYRFGSEQGDITPFLDTYKLLEGHNSELQENIKQLVKTGLSYPRALNTAYQQLIPNHTRSYADLTKPNNILGYHYVENIQKYHTNIKPITIQTYSSRLLTMLLKKGKQLQVQLVSVKQFKINTPLIVSVLFYHKLLSMQ